MTILLFILVLLVCVLVHEWGHFITAKKSGMLVEEFGFGIPPRLFSWKTGGTVYSINALPIGGFVKIAGENGLETDVPVNKQFESKSWYVRSLVLVAGVICNFLLAIILFTVAYTIGLPQITEGGTPTITTVIAGSPAEIGGLSSGDTVESIILDNAPIVPLTTESIHEAIITSDSPIIVRYTHADQQYTVELTPTGSGKDRKIGMGIEPLAVVHASFQDALQTAWKQVLAISGAVLDTLGTLVAGLFTHTSSTVDLMGPVGLAKEVGNAASFGPTYLLAFMAAISVNLAVLNIMPFPALDGGRLIIVLLEALTRRKFSKNTVGVIHTIGFAILILLMLILTVGDIRKIL